VSRCRRDVQRRSDLSLSHAGSLEFHHPHLPSFPTLCNRGRLVALCTESRTEAQAARYRHHRVERAVGEVFIRSQLSACLRGGLDQLAFGPCVSVLGVQRRCRGRTTSAATREGPPVDSQGAEPPRRGALDGRGNSAGTRVVRHPVCTTRARTETVHAATRDRTECPSQRAAAIRLAVWDRDLPDERPQGSRPHSGQDPTSRRLDAAAGNRHDPALTTPLGVHRTPLGIFADP
jgi:hypothetical protein